MRVCAYVMCVYDAYVRMYHYGKGCALHAFSQVAAGGGEHGWCLERIGTYRGTLDS